MNYAAEYVLPGHPDKLCDAIADALVEEAARRETSVMRRRGRGTPLFCFHYRPDRLRWR